MFLRICGRALRSYCRMNDDNVKKWSSVGSAGGTNYWTDRACDARGQIGHGAGWMQCPQWQPGAGKRGQSRSKRGSNSDSDASQNNNSSSYGNGWNNSGSYGGKGKGKGKGKGSKGKGGKGKGGKGKGKGKGNFVISRACSVTHVAAGVVNCKDLIQPRGHLDVDLWFSVGRAKPRSSTISLRGEGISGLVGNKANFPATATLTGLDFGIKEAQSPNFGW